MERHAIDSRSYAMPYGEAVDFSRKSVPVLVSMRHTNDKSGNFYIILNADDEHITVLQTGYLLVSVFDVDDFRKKWTGQVLVPVEMGDNFASTLIALGVLCLVVASWAAIRLMRRLRRENARNRAEYHA
jgi:hypothetical protein